MNKYPIGLQDFGKIRTDGFLYVDKTQLIHKLIDSGNYYFLSRPRRFGKSLLLSTVKEIFEGSKQLFEGLWIYDKWNWEQKNPVIHLKLSSINYQKLGLYNALNKEMDALAAGLEVTLNETDLKDKFKELIKKAAVNEKVIILIDEYDKPIIDYLDQPEIAEENRNVFKSLYSVLKDADEHIRFLLITGVTRFTKISIFSDLNNLRDITLVSDFSTLTGITQTEVEANFAMEIADMKITDPNILEKIRIWYNGYSWNGKDKVYNPFSLLNFMTDRVFSNYWFETGTPSFLVKQIREQEDYNFENIKVGKNTLGKFDVKNVLSVPLLFQTGYLTVKAHDPEFDLYTLNYPNKEVELSLLDNLLSSYREVYPGDSTELTSGLVLAFRNNQINEIFRNLDAMIASIPYDLWKADNESIFHIIAHLTFKIVGLNVQNEVHSSRGRSDVTVYTDKYIYVLELKLNASAQQALDQILDTGYLTPFLTDKRKKIAIGINFSSEKRAIDRYLVKEIQ